MDWYVSYLLTEIDLISCVYNHNNNISINDKYAFGYWTICE